MTVTTLNLRLNNLRDRFLIYLYSIYVSLGFVQTSLWKNCINSKPAGQLHIKGKEMRSAKLIRNH